MAGERERLDQARLHRSRDFLLFQLPDVPTIIECRRAALTDQTRAEALDE